MPISQYFGGKGGQVLANMIAKQGNRKRAEREFYATVNKFRKGTPAQRAAQPAKAPGGR